MQIKKSDLMDEFNAFVSKKTLDTLLPPIVFAISNLFTELIMAGALAFCLSILIGIKRLYKKEKLTYALFGVLGVLFLSSLAFLTNNAANYYLGGLISSFSLATLSLGSLLFNRPVVAIMSHLARGWPMEWFLRKDILPAYREVTLIWGLLFSLRGALQLTLYLRGSVTALAFTNAILGFPFTSTILLSSYIYGLFRLNRLKGPSVDEYLNQEAPPYKGQRKGF